jgi:adenosylcobinamide-phosphate synthase
MTARAAGLLLGHAADRLLGDPSRFHPVAGFGRTAALVEQAMYAESRMRGTTYVLVLVGGTAGLALAAEHCATHPFARALLTGTVTWAVLGGRSLDHEAEAVYAHLERGDLDAARQRLTHLVGRDTTRLTVDEVARAVVESVAENTSDAVVAPYVWGALAGVPGLVVHRAANTLDAMVGHRNRRYEQFGWAAARLDDMLGLPGSRLSGLLAAALGPNSRAALAAWRRDARHHPSPNAGVVEASFAGALGLQLGGTNIYHAPTGDVRVEHRALMGRGRHPAPADISLSSRLARRVGLGAVIAAVAALTLLRPSRSLVVRAANRWPRTAQPSPTVRAR